MLVSLSAVESLVKVSKPYATHFIRQTSLLEHFIGYSLPSFFFCACVLENQIIRFNLA